MGRSTIDEAVLAELEGIRDSSRSLEGDILSADIRGFDAFGELPLNSRGSWPGCSRRNFQGDFVLGGFDGIDESLQGWWTRVKKRAKQRRVDRRQRRKARWARYKTKWHAYVKKRRRIRRRRIHNYCKTRKKWCRFWDKNWSRILRVINWIGGAIATCIPFVGAIVGPALACVGEACIRAGEKAYRCATTKGKKKCWKEGFKGLGEGLMEGAISTISNVASKYGKDVKLGDGLTSKFKDILSKPEVKKLKGLYEKLDKATGPARDKIDKEIDEIESSLMPVLTDFEEEVDNEYWDKTGFKREWREDEVLVREDRKGDKWGLWDSDADPPEGIVDGVWYRMSGKTASMEAQERLGERADIGRAGKGEIASTAETRAREKGTELWAEAIAIAKNARLSTLPIPEPKELGQVEIAELVKRAQAKGEGEAFLAKIKDKKVFRVGRLIMVAVDAADAKAQVERAAASGRIPPEMASELGFTKKFDEVPWYVWAGGAAIIVAGGMMLMRRR